METAFFAIIPENMDAILVKIAAVFPLYCFICRLIEVPEKVFKVVVSLYDTNVTNTDCFKLRKLQI
jgi:hypothetical protein